MAKLWPVQSILAGSMAVARQNSTPVCKEKSKNLVEGGGWYGVKKWLGTCPGVP